MNREAAREWTLFLRKKYLPQEQDGYQVFLRLATDSCPVGGRVLDLGCGGEDYLSFLLEKAGEIVGIDVRPLGGNYHRYVQADLTCDIPVPPGSADLAVSKFLLEHLSDPGAFFNQVSSMLRPGGILVTLTPNIYYYPYSVNYLLSRILPQELRMGLVRLITGRTPEEIFPVDYLCNTPGRVKRELERAGLQPLHLETYSDCLVGALNRPLGALAIVYEKLINIAGIKGMKGFIVVQARKVQGNRDTNDTAL